MELRTRFSLAVLLSALWVASSAGAVVVAPVTCPTSGLGCTFTIGVDGSQVGSGAFSINSSGQLVLAAPLTITLPDGGSAGVTAITGSADPVLGFSVAASTTAAGHSFAFAFSLPIDLSGPLAANSSVSYSLTSLTSAGAQIQALASDGKVVTAQEVDTAVGGLPPLNKGVDVGNTFFFTGGPQTQNSQVFTASSTLTGNPSYDIMSVLVTFALSSESDVGASGFVQQLAVPEPSTFAMLSAGLGFVALAGRRLRS